MLPGERIVAGVSCSEVLADLSAYLDGELEAARVAQLEAHVSQCSVCAAFGAGFGRVITAMRANKSAPDRLSEAVAGRLQASLYRATSEQQS